MVERGVAFIGERGATGFVDVRGCRLRTENGSAQNPLHRIAPESRQNRRRERAVGTRPNEICVGGPELAGSPIPSAMRCPNESFRHNMPLPLRPNRRHRCKGARNLFHKCFRIAGYIIKAGHLGQSSRRKDRDVIAAARSKRGQVLRERVGLQQHGRARSIQECSQLWAFWHRREDLPEKRPAGSILIQHKGEDRSRRLPQKGDGRLVTQPGDAVFRGIGFRHLQKGLTLLGAAKRRSKRALIGYRAAISVGSAARMSVSDAHGG